MLFRSLSLSEWMTDSSGPAELIQTDRLETGMGRAICQTHSAPVRLDSARLTAAPTGRPNKETGPRTDKGGGFSSGRGRVQDLGAVSEHSDKWHLGVHTRRKTNCCGPGAGEEVRVRLRLTTQKELPSTVIRGSGPHLATWRGKRWLMCPTQRATQGRWDRSLFSGKKPTTEFYRNLDNFVFWELSLNYMMLATT